MGALGGSPTWTPSPSRISPPLSFLPPEGKVREREGEGKRGERIEMDLEGGE